MSYREWTNKDKILEYDQLSEDWGLDYGSRPKFLPNIQFTKELDPYKSQKTKILLTKSNVSWDAVGTQDLEDQTFTEPDRDWET